MSAMIKRMSTRRKATASVEFAVILPVLLVFLLGAWEVGRLIEVKQLLNNSAREGARQAATGTMTTAEVKAHVVENLRLNGITATVNDVQVTNLRTNTALDPKSAEQLDQYEVTVTIQFNSVKWIMLDQITGAETITGTSTWNSMRDVPLEVDSDVPLN